jgi:hypothetical protein
LALGPGHEAVLAIRKETSGSAIVELGVEFAQGGGVLEEVVEDGGEGDGGCFGAGEGHADGHGGDEGVGHEFWSVDLGLHEFGQQVWLGHRFHFIGGQDWGLPIFCRGVAFCHAVLGECSDGHGGVYEAPFGKQEVEGIFEEEKVESGDLTDLCFLLVYFSRREEKGERKEEIPEQRSRKDCQYNPLSPQHPYSPPKTHVSYYTSSRQ